jgi:uncharacterized membrane protein YidH (DUF202 family)
MNGKAEWVGYVVAVLVLGVGAVLFGMALLPDPTVAGERGVTIPWLLTWAMIGVALVTAAVIAGYLVMTGGGQVKR